jgi:hypothetical protein
MNEAALKTELIALRSVSAVVAILICSFVAGCGSPARQEEMPSLRLLSSFYAQYRGHHRGQLARDEADLKQFIASVQGEALPRTGIASVDELFISTRDGKPFVVKYRGNRSWPLPEAVAYESEGRDGTRFVATIGGGLGEISDDELRGKGPASGSAKQ